MSAPAPLRRAALHITLSLALGALTTIATAWACAAWSTLNPKSLSQRFAPSASTGSPDLTSLGFLASHIDPASVSRSTYAIIAAERGFGLSDTTILLLHYFGDSAGCDDAIFLHRTGWPLPALRCIGTANGASWTWESSCSAQPALVRTAYPASMLGRPPRPPIPLRPDFPGFAINTLMYACIIFIALPSTRRSILYYLRTRRNLCPRCAYDLSGLTSRTCPECGTCAISGTCPESS